MEFKILTDLVVRALKECDRSVAEYVADYLLSNGVTVKIDIEEQAKDKIRSLELQNQYLMGVEHGFKFAIGKGEN